MERVTNVDFVSQIPGSQDVEPDDDVIITDLEEKSRLNVEEAKSFCKLVKTRTASMSTLVESPNDQQHLFWPVVLRKLEVTLRVTKEGIGKSDALFFIRGLLMQLTTVLEYLKSPGNQLTMDILKMITEAATEIDWIFEIYERSDSDDFSLVESAIPDFLNFLFLFVIGEKKDFTASVQSDRTEVVYSILKQLKSPTLQLCVFRHLVAQIKMHISQISVTLKTNLELCSGGVIDSAVMNSIFSFTFLLECFLVDMKVIEETDLKSLKLLEVVTISGHEFQAFPLIALTIQNLVSQAKKYSE